MKTIAIGLLISMSLGAIGSADAAMFRCKTKDGRTLYTNEACESQSASEVKSLTGSSVRATQGYAPSVSYQAMRPQDKEKAGLQDGQPAPEGAEVARKPNPDVRFLAYDKIADASSGAKREATHWYDSVGNWFRSVWLWITALF